MLKTEGRLPESFAAVDEVIANNFRALMSATRKTTGAADADTRAGSSETMLAAALSSALCFINACEKKRASEHVRSRILVVSVSPDSTRQYISIMNSIFAAQKMVHHSKLALILILN